MILFACPIPANFAENPIRWYSEHWETASNPAYVEWARSESLTFLSFHLVAGFVTLVVVLGGLTKLYISHGAKLKNRQRACLGGILSLTAVVAFACFWNVAKGLAFPHVSAEAQMILLEGAHGLAIVFPAIPAIAALLVTAGIRKNAKSPSNPPR